MTKAVMEYCGNLRNVRLTDTAFASRLEALTVRLTLPDQLPWHVIFRQFRLAEQPGDPDIWVLQVADDQGVDNVTGGAIQWRGRKWMLNRAMTDGEIVRTVLAAYLAACEHEVREQIRVDGVAVLDPHFDLDKQVVFGRNVI